MDLHDHEPDAFGHLDTADLQDAGGAPFAPGMRSPAQVLAPDANGVVVLPAGTELGDIRIEGRDLVVVGADGVRYVIPEGAIIVPQLVVDGVVIPPLNLAALLVGNEPQPAAGRPQSSGGNFASDVGPLQAAFDLGDLLPYTELAFPQAEEREVIPQALDRDPLVTVFTPDQPAGVQDATASVAEAGLPARAGEPAGSNASASSETTTGSFVIDSPDGIAALSINGTAFTGAGQVFTTPRGTLTITGFDPATGTATFTYTLTDNLVGGTVGDQFAILVTDPDGDVATGTLTINVADDAPTARNDTDAVPAANYTAQTGNVITGSGTTSGAAGADTLGADNATITRIASNSVTANADTSLDASGNLQVAGQYGTLLIKADGSYSYTRNSGTPGGVSDAFTYTLTDADGSASTATLTIAIPDATPVITSVPPTGDFAAGTLVFEAGLPPRTGEAPGTDTAAPTETTSGTVTFAGGDGPVTATINGVAVAPGAVVTVPGVGTLTINTFDPVTGAITYSFTLADNTSGDTTSVTFAIVITDVDGDSAPGTFTIAIRDDAPVAVNDSATQASENAPVTVDLLANDTQGADSVQPGAVVVVAGTLTGTGTLTNNGNGTVTYVPAPGESGTVTFSYQITDGDGDVSRATGTIVLLADSTPTISAAGDNTVSEAALPARGAEPAGSNAASPDETAAGTIAIATGNDAIASLVVNGQDVTGGGTVTTAKGVLTVTLSGGAYSYSYTLADNTLADPDSDSFTLVVTDSDGDSASTSLVVAIADDSPRALDDAGVVAAGTYGPITGDVRANDTQGADGAVVVSYSGVTSGAAGSTVAGQYGTLTIAAEGGYSYTRNPGTPGGVSDTFSYTIRDADGDEASAALVIAIADSGTTLTLPPALTPGVTQVFEAGLGSAGATGSAATGNGEFASGSFTFTAPDGPATVTIGGVAVTAVGQTFAGASGTLTITSIAAGSIGYTYELTSTTAGDTTSDTFVVRVTDQDGESSQSNLTIAIVDDVPTARTDPAAGAFEVAEQTPLTIPALANDTAGADGVVLNGAVAVASPPSKGSVVYNGDGTFTYTPNARATGEDSFTYTITDGDGDPSTATVNLNLLADSTPSLVSASNLAVDEDGFAAANLDAAPLQPAPQETDGSESLTDTSGVAVFDFKADVPAVLAGSAVLLDTPALDGQLLTLDNQNVVFKLEGGALVGRAGSDAGPEVIRIALTGAAAGPVAGQVSYSYSVTLSQPVKHAAAGSEDLAALTGVTIEVTDLDGSTATGTFSVSVRDDVPSALEEAGGSLAEGGTATGTLDFVAGADGASVSAVNGTALVFGADGFSQAITLLSAGGTPVGAIKVKADGSYSFTANNPLSNPVDAVGTFTVTDRDGDAASAAIRFTVTDANAPTGGNAAAAVDDDGLAGGNPASTIEDFDANAGDTPSDVSEQTFTGTLAFTPGGDAPVTVSFAAGADGAFAQVGLERVQYTVVGNLLTARVAATAADNITPQARAGTTLFTVEITDAATGAYKITLVSNVLHAGGPNDENPLAADASASIAFTVTDSDGSTAAATLGVRFDDDAPTAAATSATQAAENQQVVVSIAGSYAAGADGVNLAQVTHSGAAQGTVSYNGAGVFTYTPNAGAGSGGNTTDSFTYTVVDGDGDSATATVTINLQPDSGPVANDVTARIDDDGLPAGNPASVVGDENQNAGESGAGTASEAVWTGSLSVQAGANDTPLTYSLASAAGSGAVGTETVDFTWNALTNTLTATVAAAQARAGTVLFTVRIDDPATGAYTVTLVNPIAHDPLTGAPGDDTENNTSVALTYTVSDSDSPADSDTGLITIDFDDDMPSAAAVSATQAAENTAFDIAIGGSFAAGADGLAAITFTDPAQGTLVLSGTTFTYTPNAGAGSTSTSDSFTYTVTDKDGDKVTETVSITLKPDSTPTFKSSTNLAVDEDGFANANADNGQASPLETTGSNSLTDTGGSIVFDFKADVPATIAGSAVLVDTAALDGQLKTLANEDVVFRLEGADLVGRAGTFAGAEVIRIALGAATNTPPSTEVTYAYSVTLAQPVKHATAGTEDLATLTGVTIEVTDRDADKTTGSFDVTVRDDVPSLDVTKGAEAGVLLSTQDAETDGSPTDEDTAIATAGIVTAGFAGVFGLGSVKGADGGVDPALSYALNVTAAASGLMSHGADINLYKISDSLIVGSTAGVNPGGIDGSAVFSVSVAADGTVTLTQYQQVDHAPEASPVPGTGAPFDDQFASLADGLVTLTASASLSDGDGDVASDSETVSIGANLRFHDDGPALSNVAAGAGVTLDESTAGANFAAGPIGGTSASAVITATAAFGADGPLGNTAAAGTAYGLELAGSGATLLATAIGDFPITLVKTAPNVIEGQYTDGTTQTAFVLTIGTDGKLTVEQRVALEHTQDGDTAADYDDPLNLAGLVNATITLTDFDGDTATESAAIGNLVVFEDDGVDAVPDSGSVPAGSSAQIAGNVLGNDYRGADGSTITAVTNAGAGTSGTLAAGVLTIQGEHGVLKLTVATGAYTYDRTPGAGGGDSDVFTYTLTDNDGDFDTATLTIDIGDLIPVAGAANATLDDEGLAGGIAGGAGDIDANTPAGRTADLDQLSTEAVFKGTLGSGPPASVPGDGTNAFYFLPAGSQTATTIGQETVSYTVSPDGLTLTATITGSPAGRTGTLFAVQITDPATGAYTLTLEKPVLHAEGGGEDGDIDIALAYQLKDAGNDTSVLDGALSIRFDDDSPTASASVNTAQTDDEGKAPYASQSNEGALVGTDVADSPATASGSSLFAAGADGLRSIAFTNPVGLKAIHDVGGIPQHEDIAYTTTVDGAGNTTLTARGVTSAQVVFTMTINADGSYLFTQSRALVHSGAGEDERDIAFGFTVTDRDGDTASGSITVTVDDDTPVLADDTDALLAGATGPATGNVLTDADSGDAGDGDSGADTLGADGGSVTAITGFGGAGTVGGTTTGKHGTLTINADGSYSYTRTGAGPVSDTDTFTYTVTDGDGDSATATLTITLQDAAPVAGAADATVDDEGLAGGIPGGTGDLDANTPAGRTADLDQLSTEAVFKGILGGAAGDGASTFFFAAGLDGSTQMVGQETVTYAVGGTAVISGATTIGGLTLTATGPRGVLFTITITDPATGAYTLELKDNVLHPDGAAENDVDIAVPYQMRDADGDLSLLAGSLSIRFDDDVPVADIGLAAGVFLTLDETDGVIAANEVDPSGGNLGVTTLAAASYLASAHQPGADGIAATAYSLAVSSAGVASGYIDSATNQAIVLVKNASGVVEGRVNSVSGPIAFTIAVDSASGQVTLSQFRGIKHTNTASTDEPSPGMAAGALTLTAEITDADGDKSSDFVDLGSIVRIEDDGATLGAFQSATIPNAIGTVVGTFILAGGADGIQNFTISGPPITGLIYSSATTTSPSGIVTTTLTATADPDGAGPLPAVTVFTLAVNSDGTYSFNLVTPQAATTQTLSLTSLRAGGPGFRELEDDAGTPNVNEGGRIEFTSNGTGVNATSNDFGVSNTDVDPGEFFVAEFHNPGAVGNDLPESNPEFLSAVTFNVNTLRDSPGSEPGSRGPNATVRWTATNTVTGATESGTVTVTSTGPLLIDPSISFNQIRIENFNDPALNNDGARFSISSVTISKTILPQDQNLDFTITATDRDGDTTAPQSLDVQITASTGGGFALTGDRVANESDAIASSASVDTITGAGGFDVADYSDSAGAVSINLDDFGNASGAPVTFSSPANGNIGGGDAAGDSLAGIEGLRGGAGNDVLIGNSGANLLVGNAGNDSLNGEGGNDVLVGGTGLNTLTGGSGTDTFVIDSSALTEVAQVDVITDYAPGEIIDLTAVLNVPSNLDAVAGGYLRYTTTGALQVDVTGGADSWVTVAQTSVAAASATVRYQSGSTTTTVVLTPVALPIVLDLDGDGVEFVDSAAGAVFDYNGDGNAVATAWAGGDDGILALDANGNGAVDSGAEIVFGFDGKTDLEGLAAKYDSNADGVLDARDAAFGRFGVWRDADGDGVSDPGEFRLLSDAGIVSLSLTTDGQAYSAANGEVQVAGTGSFARADGTVGKLADAAFATNARTAQRTAELLATTAVAGALVDSSLHVVQPEWLAAGAERARPQVETMPPGIEDLDPLPAGGANAPADLLAARPDAEGPADRTIAHFRGETTAARLVDPGADGDETRPFDLFDAPDTEPSTGRAPASLFDAGGGGEGMMQALLSLPHGAPGGAAPASIGPAAVRDALSDFAGEQLVDALVDRFAPQASGPAVAMPAGGDGLHLLSHDLAGGAPAPRFAAMPDAGEDLHALIAAQA